ncbi:MAG TPA: hypothetical protein VGI61_06270, partial [Parafilimonas sp.]
FSYRNIIAFAFAIIFCIEVFGNLLTVAGYYIDSSAYAANCINKDKPQMHCNGKCQLQKKLNEENNKDKQAPERKNETGNEVLSSKSFFAVVQIPYKHFIAKKYFSINAGSPVDHSFQFFHPPQNFFI